MTQPIDNFHQQLIKQGGRQLWELKPVDLLDVLERDFALLNLRRSGDGHDAQLILGTGLAPFHGVVSAAEYVARIEWYQQEQPIVVTVPPLFVAQMLDYLSLALAAHPAWPETAPHRSTRPTCGRNARTGCEQRR